MRSLTSTASTFAYAVFLPCVTAATLSILAFVADPDSLLGPGVLLLSSILFALLRRRVATVMLDGDTLVISRYLRTVRVPLHQVASVSGSTFLSPDRIWITFLEQTPFGREITFFPVPRFLPGASMHPVAKELSALCNAARIKVERAAGERASS